MKKFLIIFALLVFTAQGSVIRSDGTLTRVARSPPPDFHTQQWSGILRNADGSQQGVFSGAAASARDDTQTVGQTFSLAGTGSASDSHPIVYPGLVASKLSSQLAALPKENQTNTVGSGRSGSASQEKTGEHAQEPGLESRFGDYADAGAHSSAFGSGQSGYGSYTNAGSHGSHRCHECAGAHSSVRNDFLYGSQRNGGSYTFGPGQSGHGNLANADANADVSKPSEYSEGNGFAYESQKKESDNAFGLEQSGFGSQPNSGGSAPESRPSTYFESQKNGVGNGFAYGSQGNGGNYPGSQQSDFESQANGTPKSLYGQYGYESQPNVVGQSAGYGNQSNTAGQSGGYGSQSNTVQEPGSYGRQSNAAAQSGGYGSQPYTVQQPGHGSQANSASNGVGSQQPGSYGSQANSASNGVGSQQPGSYGSQANSASNGVGSQQPGSYGSQANSASNGVGSQQPGSYGSQANSASNGVGSQQPGSYGSKANSATNAVESQQPGSYGSQANSASNAVGSQQPGGYGQEHQSAQSSLQGALGLANQGLQTQQAAGCSTCGKSNYAYSNAKTRTGNAIALSVNG